MDYKSVQQGLQIKAALGISNRGRKITNRGRDYKSGQEGFQIGAEITNRGRTHQNNPYNTTRVLTLFYCLHLLQTDSTNGHSTFKTIFNFIALNVDLPKTTPMIVTKSLLPALKRLLLNRFLSHQYQMLQSQ